MFWNQILVLFVCREVIFCKVEGIAYGIRKTMNEYVLNSKALFFTLHMRKCSS